MDYFEVTYKTESGEVKTVQTAERSIDHAGQRIKFLLERSFFGLGGQKVEILNVKKIPCDFVKDIPFDAANQATQGVLHITEDRAISKINDYITCMEKDRAAIKELCGSTLDFSEEWGRFYPKAREKYLDMLYKESRRLSSNVCGPANFPTRKAEKALRSADNAQYEYHGFRERAKNAIDKKARRILKNSPAALLEARALVAGRKRYHEELKKANVIFRSNKTDDEKWPLLKALKSIPERDLREGLNKGFYYGRKQGFPSWMLTNALNRLKSAREALEREEAKQNATEEDNQVLYQGDGWRIIDNRAADRYQFISDEKPDREIINVIKRKLNFRWAPSVKAWQQYRTSNGLHACKELAEYLS